MKRILILGFVLFGLSLTSCSDDDNDTFDNYMIFGRYYGECGGDCFSVFKLTTSDLWEDTSVQYYTDGYTFSTSALLADSVWDLTDHLLDSIPADLAAGPGGVTYGCPDCYDQGGIYIELGQNGLIYKYQIDQANTPDQNQDLLDFKALVVDVLNNMQ